MQTCVLYIQDLYIIYNIALSRIMHVKESLVLICMNNDKICIIVLVIHMKLLFVQYTFPTKQYVRIIIIIAI